MESTGRKNPRLIEDDDDEIESNDTASPPPVKRRRVQRPFSDGDASTEYDGEPRRRRRRRRQPASVADGVSADPPVVLDDNDDRAPIQSASTLEADIVRPLPEGLYQNKDWPELSTHISQMYQQMLPPDSSNISRHAFELFTVEDEPMDINTIIRCYLEKQRDLWNVVGLLHHHNVWNQNSISTQRVKGMIEYLYFAYQHVRASERMRRVCDCENTSVTLDNAIDLTRFGLFDDGNKIPGCTQLLMHVQQKGYQQSLRHYNDMIYTRVYNKAQQFTHAWEAVCTIEQFVFRSIDKLAEFDQFINLTQSPRTAENIAKMIAKMPDDPSLPALVKDNTVYAFSNGVLFLVDPAHPNGKQRPQPRFHAFADGPVVPNVNACKYFDQPFDPAWLDMPWRDIPTTRYDKFGKDQGWNDVVLNASGVDTNRVQTTIPKAGGGSGEFEQISVFDVFFAFETGRIMFPLETFDAFQVAPMNLGFPNTGKSTILQINKELFDEADVGIMQNNIEKQFGISAFAKENIRVVLAPELKANCGIDTAELQSIISGDPMTVAIKNLTGAPIPKWRSPILMAGNEMMKPEDPLGALIRRLLVFYTEKIIVGVDGNLKKNIIATELPALLIKGVRAYFEFVQHARNRGIWDDGVLPLYFSDIKRRLQSEVSDIHSFLGNCMCPIEIKSGNRMPFKTFKKVFEKWASQESIKPVRGTEWRWAPSFYTKAFADFHLVLKDGAMLAYNGEPEAKTNVLYGCDIRDELRQQYSC